MKGEVLLLEKSIVYHDVTETLSLSFFFSIFTSFLVSITYDVMP